MSLESRGMILLSHDYADADGDLESGTSFQWQRKVGAGDWTNISGATSSSLNLSVDGHGDRGDQLRALVKPKDGTDFGTEVASNVATVANTAPVASNVLLGRKGTRMNARHMFSSDDV